MSESTVKLIGKQLLLGESPHWDVGKQVLYYVDIFKQRIYKYNPANNEITSAYVDGGPVSFIVPIEGTQDKFVISRGREIAIVTWNGESSEPSSVEVVGETDTEGPCRTNRLNDGKCDPRGVLLAGSMGEEPTPGKFELNRGSLFSISPKKIETKLTKLGIGNGLAWDTKRNIFYYIDSLTYRVDKYDYDPKTGEFKNRKTAFDFKKQEIPGLPDGMTIDVDGYLWVACFNGSRVIQVDPESGRLLQTIPIPAEQVTCPVFGGKNLDILYVTTASMNQGKEQVHPAGCLFEVRDLKTKGFPPVNAKF